MIYLDHSATTAVDPHVVDAIVPSGRRPMAIRPASTASACARGCAEEPGDGSRRSSTASRTRSSSPARAPRRDNLAMRGVRLSQLQRADATSSPRRSNTTPSSTPLSTWPSISISSNSRAGRLPRDGGSGRYRRGHPARHRADLGDACEQRGRHDRADRRDRALQRRGVPFHTDAVQAGGYPSLTSRRSTWICWRFGAQILRAEGRRAALHAPRRAAAAGADGGGQERGRRRAPRTCLHRRHGRALEIAHAERGRRRAPDRAARPTDRRPHRGHDRRPLTGHPSSACPAIQLRPASRRRAMLIALDLAGWRPRPVRVRQRRADPSHVLTAMGYAPRMRWARCV